MAVTQNTFTGNGSTVLYSFTFPYLASTDIKVSVNGTNTTAYTLANATTIQFTTAPANGAAIRIYRTTDDAQTKATFFPGSSIRAQNLNDNFTQNLYVTQEANNVSAAASTTAAGAVTTANTALSQSATAISTANTASSNASAAVSTSITAAASAAAAVSTANTSSTNSTAAVNSANSAVATANSASTAAAGAVSTANAATTTANSALANAATAVTTANTASSNATAAVSTANTASSNASAAVSTANTASTNASTAVTTANTANSKADQAIAVVGNSVLYTLVSNVAGIPASPTNNKAVEVYDSTGIESFTPLTGKPAGFVGSPGLSARIIYTTSGSTWNWVQYFPNDPETRYVKFGGGTLTGPLTLAGAPTTGLQPATKTYVDAADATLTTAVAAAQTTANTAATNATAAQTTANAALPKSGGTMIGPLGLTAGYATAPSIQIGAGTGVTPGLYSPATDSLAFATQGNGRLFVTAAGSVGIGVSSPDYKFQVNEGNIGVRSYLGSNSSITFEQVGYGVASVGVDSNISALRIKVFDGTSFVERLRIDSAGNSTFTGTVIIPAGASISGYLTTATAASTYLTSATAGTTYQTQAGMSSYLTTASATSTYRPKADLNKVDASVSLAYFMGSF